MVAVPAPLVTSRGRARLGSAARNESSSAQYIGPPREKQNITDAHPISMLDAFAASIASSLASLPTICIENAVVELGFHRFNL